MPDLKSNDLKHSPGRDQDRGKGAVEQDKPDQADNTSMQGQLGHRIRIRS
jgi:hypothetical protein